MITYFSDFLGTLFCGFFTTYIFLQLLYGILSFRDFFQYRPSRDIRDI